jgi:hypothetical protein
VSVQLRTVPAVLPSKTAPVDCDPKPVPVNVTDVPGGPDVGSMAVMSKKEGHP